MGSRYYVDMKRGKFIVIDGMDGSGKGTQIKRIQEAVPKEHFVFTREPGGTPKAEEIREMLLRQDGPVSNPLCDFFLFWASRASHVEDLVAPSLAAGLHVLTDRYDSSTFAFQMYGEGRIESLKNLFFTIRSTLPPQYIPDAYIILDLPPEVAFERRRADAGQEKTRFDVKPLEYHTRVREGFAAFQNAVSGVHLVDANRTPDEVHADVLRIITTVTV